MSIFPLFLTTTSPSAISPLSLHDALPISADTIFDFAAPGTVDSGDGSAVELGVKFTADSSGSDRKSTRLNSSHRCISYAVFCLKKKRHLSPATTDAQETP